MKKRFDHGDGPGMYAVRINNTGISSRNYRLFNQSDWNCYHIVLSCYQGTNPHQMRHFNAILDADLYPELF